MAVFRLLVLRGRGPFWWKYDPKEEVYIDIYDTKITAHPNHLILDEVQSESFGELDWKKTAVVEPDPEDLSIGWIDRNGRHYRCSYENHDMYARFILRTTVNELEQRGWIRVFGKLNPSGYDIWHGFESEYQKNTLRNLGYEIEGEE
jgi:hypothetical protein